jgi:cell wall-associated NlpC family hydrolase
LNCSWISLQDCRMPFVKGGRGTGIPSFHRIIPLQYLHTRNLRSRPIPHQNQAMSVRINIGVAALFCTLFVRFCPAIEVAVTESDPSTVLQVSAGGHNTKHDHSLTENDRAALMATALDSRSQLLSERDCSHLVHSIYEQAGFPYVYASSYDLYDGIESFRRVSHPLRGDLVVWRGHAGIVINPSRHIFYSFLHDGPGTDDYQSAYWKGRGHPRFYRYAKSDSCSQCRLLRSSSRKR